MSDRALARVLGLRDLILIVIGTVIGSGIFLVPGGVIRDAGGYAGPALVVWMVGGVLSLLGALAYGELGAMNPAAGGLYVYLRDAFGPVTAFLYGWTFFVVIATGSAATSRDSSITRACRTAGSRWSTQPSGFAPAATSAKAKSSPTTTRSSANARFRAAAVPDVRTRSDRRQVRN